MAAPVDPAELADPVVAEFVAQLASLAREHAGEPHAELDALWRIGLEREALVTIAYRHDVIEHRLARMPIDPATRTAVARAIRWTWRDEEAHTVWVRGALIRRGRAVGSVLTQLEGRLGGWVASRQNHYSWTDAPLVKLVAEAIEAVGVASGRVPPAVRTALHWNTFSAFCQFQRAAETTAALAWRRMLELSTELAATDDALGFARMAADEERHARIFTALAAAFDADDRLLTTAAALRGELAAVGQRFVAVPDPDRPAWNNPLGKGGTVVVRHGDDAAATVGAVLDAIGLAVALARAPGATVAIKTTFMLVTDRRDPSPGVGIPVLAAAIAWLEARGARVQVIDARNLYDRFHAGRRVGEVARYLGVPGAIVDAQDDQVAHAYPRGLAVGTLARTWRDADLRLLIGKLRTHPTSTAMLALEAAEGLAGRHDQFLWLERQSERETAILMALDAAPPDAALLDAWDQVPDGLLGVFGTRQPLAPHRIYGSTDAVALDAVAARHAGADPDRPELLVDVAFDWFGDPRTTTIVDGPDTPIAGFRLPDHSDRTALLSALALPLFTLASGRGALFLPGFDVAAFPPLGRAPLGLRLARAAVRRIVADPPSATPDLTPTDDLLPTTMLGGVRIARLGSGPPVVFLHGYPDTLQVWSRVAPRIAAGGREAIAIDWPGLGYSAPAAGGDDPDALAEQLVAVLDAAGLARVDVVAADMGAPPALVLAARHPERVRRVVVTSALLFDDEPTSLEIRVMRIAGLAGPAFRFAPQRVYARCVRSFLPAGDRLPPALDADLAGAFRRRAVRDRLARMCAAYDRALPRLPERYWQIRAPIATMWAGDDHHFAPSHAERLAALVPGTRTIVIPGARHWMMLTRADEVAAQLAALLGDPA